MAVYQTGHRINLYFFLFLLSYLFSPLIILAAWLGLRFSIGEWFRIYTLYAISMLLLILLAYPIRWITRRDLEQLIFPWRRMPDAPQRKILRELDQAAGWTQLQWRDFAAISWVILIAGFSGTLFWRTLVERETLFTSSESLAFLPVFFFWTFWMAGGVLFLIIGSTTLYFLRRRLNSRHPQTVVSLRLLEVLSLLERRPEAWGEAAFKQAVVQKLEDAAMRAEYDLPRQQRSGDPATDAWLAWSFAGIAYSLRERKKRILLPEAGARQALVDFLARELPHAAVGDLGSLERIEEAAPNAFIIFTTKPAILEKVSIQHL